MPKVELDQDHVLTLDEEKLSNCGLFELQSETSEDFTNNTKVAKKKRGKKKKKNSDTVLPDNGDIETVEGEPLDWNTIDLRGLSEYLQMRNFTESLRRNLM